MDNLRYFDKIRYGSFKDLDVLVDPSDNSLWVTQTTIVKLLGYTDLDATGIRARLNSRKFKDFAGCRFQDEKTLKQPTGSALAGVKKIKAIDSIGRPNEVNAVPFDTFLSLVYFEAFEGKDPYQTKARSLVVTGFADSFSSLILEQCGIKLTIEERNNIVTFYLDWYHKFYDWVRDTHVALYGEKPNSDYYKNMTVLINNHLFGKSHFKCNRLVEADNLQLRRLENFQMEFLNTKSAKSGKDPITAMSHYINVMSSL